MPAIKRLFDADLMRKEKKKMVERKK